MDTNCAKDVDGRVTRETAAEIARLLGLGVGTCEVARRVGVGRYTVYRVSVGRHWSQRWPDVSGRCRGCGALVTGWPCRTCAARQPDA